MDRREKALAWWRSLNQQERSQFFKIHTYRPGWTFPMVDKSDSAIEWIYSQIETHKPTLTKNYLETTDMLFKIFEEMGEAIDAKLAVDVINRFNTQYLARENEVRRYQIWKKVKIGDHVNSGWVQYSLPDAGKLKDSQEDADLFTMEEVRTHLSEIDYEVRIVYASGKV